MVTGKLIGQHISHFEKHQHPFKRQHFRNKVFTFINIGSVKHDNDYRSSNSDAFKTSLVDNTLHYRQKNRTASYLSKCPNVC